MIKRLLKAAFLMFTGFDILLLSVMFSPEMVDRSCLIAFVTITFSYVWWLWFVKKAYDLTNTKKDKQEK